MLRYAHATIVERACAHIPVTAAMVDDGHVTDRVVKGRVEASLTELVGQAGLPRTPLT